MHALLRGSTLLPLAGGVVYDIWAVRFLLPCWPLSATPAQDEPQSAQTQLRHIGSLLHGGLGQKNISVLFCILRPSPLRNA